MMRWPRPGPHASSLRWRFAVALSGAVLVCTAVCVAAAVLFLTQELTNGARSDLWHTLNGVSGYVDNQRHDLLGIAELVASDPKVQASALADDRPALIVHLAPIYADLNADVMDVIDARGRVVVRMEDTLVSGDMVGDRPGIREALAGHEVTGLENDLPGRQAADGYALRAMVPIRHGARIVGAVVVGRQLGTIFAERIGRALNANVNLIAGSWRTGTTLTDSTGLPITGLAEPASVIRRIRLGKQSVARVDETGSTVLSGLVPLATSDGRWVGAIEIVRPLTALYDVTRTLSLLLLLIGAIVVVLGTMVGLNISRRLTSRLSLLQDAASRASARAKDGDPLGELPAVRVVGGDEVDSLARSFSSMMQALDERMAANAELYSASQARVRELSGLAEIARLLTDVSSMRATLDRLSEHVSRLIGAQAVAIWLPGDTDQPALHGGWALPPQYGHLSNNIVQHTATTGFKTAAQVALRTGHVEFRHLATEEQFAGSSQAELLAQMQASGWTWATAVPLRLQGRVVGAMTCYTAGERHPGDEELNLLTTIADQVAVAVENARLATEAQARVALEERLQAQEALERRVEERTRELSTLLDVSRNVASTLDLERLLGLILNQLETVLHNDGAAILMLQADYLVVLARCLPAPIDAPLPPRYSVADHGMLWEALRNGDPVIINDVRGDEATARIYQRLVGEHLQSGFEFEQSVMLVPMLLKDQIVGIVSLSSRRREYFTAHHAALTQAVAQQAAIAIENARLFEQAQEVAILEERQRLARELHDSVSQALYGVALGAKTARALLDQDPEQAKEPLEYVLTQAEAGLTEMRALIFELRPQALETEGLIGALRKQVDAIHARHGIAVQVGLETEPDVPFEVKEGLYRIAQEALHNVVKHSRATSIQVELSCRPEGLTLEVRDDGQGFDPGDAFPGHLGLRTMRERALRLGGALTVNSVARGGTQVRVAVPPGMPRFIPEVVAQRRGE